MPSKLKAKLVDVAALKRSAQVEAAPVLEFDVPEFRRKLMRWYRQHARKLPWRGVDDPYKTWLSEIMLQQTRVATVMDRYQEFLVRFPTITDLAAADEADVLALWSGLGYYRRARMLHRGAQFVEREMQGQLPRTAVELRTLPGVGEYTAAAIASIAFGESIAVLDGNVERVLLRLMGEPEEKSAQARARLVVIAGMLTPPAQQRRHSAHSNPAGDHNQAMMELGATICLPRSPLCLQCPVMAMCRTRGEHVTPARTKMQSRTVAHLLALRKRGVVTEVLLERRSDEASLMAGMLELPGLPLDVTEGREPALRLRHAITTTNYYVQIFTESVVSDGGTGEPAVEHSLVEQIPAAKAVLDWVPTSRLVQLPLTGMTRKALRRLQVIMLPQVKMGRE
jgi:A/G-specific adenine glycosylase